MTRIFYLYQKLVMPVISMFYGIIIRMFYYDNKEHHIPHIHIEFAEYKAVIEIPTGKMIAGDFPNEKMKLVQAWMEIHKERVDGKLETGCCRTNNI